MISSDKFHKGPVWVISLQVSSAAWVGFSFFSFSNASLFKEYGNFTKNKSIEFFYAYFVVPCGSLPNVLQPRKDHISVWAKMNIVSEIMPDAIV